MPNTVVKMPQLGESVSEGTIGRWLKQPGERVERDEPLVEIQTDKVNAEVPSPVAGILQRGDTRRLGRSADMKRRGDPGHQVGHGRIDHGIRQSHSSQRRPLAHGAEHDQVVVDRGAALDLLDGRSWWHLGPERGAV